MNTSLDQHAEVDVEKLAIEYRVLRDEILKRIELRQQFTSITLAIAGIFLGIGVTTDTVALLYPLLVLFLATGWAHNDWRIAELATYIRECIEKNTPYLHWETYVHQTRGETHRSGWHQVLLSYGGTFIFTQLTAIAIGVLRFQSTATEWVLLLLDIVAVGWVVYVIVRAKKPHGKVQSGKPKCHSPTEAHEQK